MKEDGLLLVVLVHTAATLAMTGVIWFVQVVHYPLFDRVGAHGFADYEQGHTRRTGWVVMPLMLAEAGSAMALAVWMFPGFLAWVGLGLLVGVWLSTFLLQVPQHRRLAAGFDDGAHRRLVTTNWVRTALWTGRSVVALALLEAAI
jgi:hypothetical protein